MMLGGPDAGEDGRVAGIRDGGKDSADASGVGAIFQEAAQVGNFQAVLVGLENVIRTHSVDGDQEKERLRGKREGQREEGGSEHAGIIPLGGCGARPWRAASRLSRRLFRPSSAKPNPSSRFARPGRPSPATSRSAVFSRGRAMRESNR